MLFCMVKVQKMLAVFKITEDNLCDTMTLSSTKQSSEGFEISTLVLPTEVNVDI
jgi:hypothetical protein